MKISIAVLCTVFTVSALAQTADPVIMTIGGKSVNKSEFESIYHKNNSKTVTDPKSVNEYADLFSLFKMKVYESLSQATTCLCPNQSLHYLL